MCMTFREFIRIVGYDHFHRIAAGWYNEEFVMSEGLDHQVDRYALLADSPFWVINEAYNHDYEQDNSIGSYYDWLSRHPTDQEIDKWLEDYTNGKED